MPGTISNCFFSDAFYFWHFHKLKVLCSRGFADIAALLPKFLLVAIHSNSKEVKREEFGNKNLLSPTLFSVIIMACQLLEPENYCRGNCRVKLKAIASYLLPC